jgi:hypothetical protein
MEHRQHTRDKTNTKKEMNTFLFVDYQAIIAESDTLLQKSTHRLESIISEYGLTISTSKIIQWYLEEERPIEARQ